MPRENSVKSSPSEIKATSADIVATGPAGRSSLAFALDNLPPDPNGYDLEEGGGPDIGGDVFAEDFDDGQLDG